MTSEKRLPTLSYPHLMGYSMILYDCTGLYVREHKIDILIRILSLPYRNNHVLERGIPSSALHLRDKSSMQNRRVLPHDVKK